jgi:adenylate cyclase
VVLRVWGISIPYKNVIKLLIVEEYSYKTNLNYWIFKISFFNLLNT